MILPLPLGSEEAPAHLPPATSALIAINLIVALAVNGPADRAATKKVAELERLAGWALEKERARDPSLAASQAQYPDALAFLTLDKTWRERSSGETRSRLEGYQEELDQVRSAHPFYRFGFVPTEITIVRLVAHQFIHGDALHLLFNMIFLWSAGSFLESTWGAWPVVASYLSCGAMAALTHAATHPASIEPAVGASGAVAGLMGAILVSNPLARVRIALVTMLSLAPRIRFFTAPAAPLIALWLVSQIFFTLMTVHMNPGVAFAAHLGGFGAGAAAGIGHRLLGRLRGRPRATEL